MFRPVALLLFLLAMAGGPAAQQDDAKLAETSLTQSVQGESGLSIQSMCTNCNSADISLGGLGNEHVAMTCDGLPVPPGLPQIYLLSVLPPTVIDNIEVEKGAGHATVDAGAVGGEIDFSRREVDDTLQLNTSIDAGSYGWSGARLDLGGRARWFSGSLVGSWGVSDAIDADGDANNDQPEIDRLTLEARTEIDLPGRQGLELGATHYQEEQIGGRAAFYRVEDANNVWNVEDVDFERRQYDLTYEARVGESAVKIAGMFADRNADIEESLFGPDSQRIPSYFIDEETRFASAGWSRTFRGAGLIRVGASYSERRYDVVDVRFNLFNPNIPFDDSFTFSQGEVQDETGFFVETEWALGSKVHVAAGLRHVSLKIEDSEDRPQWLAFELADDSRLLPRAAISYKPVAPLTLRLSAGAGYRLPDPAYEEVCCGRRFRGNRGIRMERSRAVGLELTYQPGDRARFSSSLFVTDFRDLVAQLASLSFNNQPTYQNVNIDDARFTAFDLQFDVKANEWWAIRASYARLNAENRNPNDEFVALIDFFNQPQEVTLTSEKVPFKARSGAVVGVDITPPDSRLTVGIDTQYTGRIVIERWDPDQRDLSTGSQLILFEDSKSFWVVNARASYSIGAGLALFVGVDNLGDFVQTDLDDPETDYTWGPLRGRYVYGGINYQFALKR